MAPPPRPWRDEEQLARVGKYLYNKARLEDGKEKDGRIEACEMVQIWGLKGPVPHYINATAGLVKAVLHDKQSLPLPPLRRPLQVQREEQNSDEGDGGDQAEGDAQIEFGDKSITIVANSVSCTYAIALVHFVTGFTDTQQTRKEKISMYRAAEGIGLDYRFVDLRNDIVHVGKLPLGYMRDLTVEALQWLWDNYWKGTITSAEERTEERRRIKNEYFSGIEWMCIRLEKVVEEFATFTLRVSAQSQQTAASNGDSIGSDTIKKSAATVKETCDNMRERLLVFADLLVSHTAFQESMQSEDPPSATGQHWQTFLVEISLLQSDFLFEFSGALIRQIAIPKTHDQSATINKSLAIWLARPWVSEQWDPAIHENRLLPDDFLFACLARPNQWTLQAATLILYQGRHEDLNIEQWERRLDAAKRSLNTLTS